MKNLKQRILDIEELMNLYFSVEDLSREQMLQVIKEVSLETNDTLKKIKIIMEMCNEFMRHF